MARVTKIIFVETNGNIRVPMAAELFQRLYSKKDMEAIGRGIFVPFEEPLNQKTEAVMVSNGMSLSDFTSKQLENYEITDLTLIFTMDEAQRQEVLRLYESATEENTFVLSDFVGDELEIIDPYGGTLQTYGICYELMKKTIQKLLTMMDAGEGIFQ